MNLVWLNMNIKKVFSIELTSFFIILEEIKGYFRDLQGFDCLAAVVLRGFDW